MGVFGTIGILEARNVDSMKTVPLLSTVIYETLIPEFIAVVYSLTHYVLSRAQYDRGYKWATRMDNRIFYNAVLQNNAIFLDYTRGCYKLNNDKCLS